MKNLIRVVALLALMTGLCEATTLSGTIKNPDNTNAVGTLYLRLANPGALQTTGSCGGPAQIIGGPNTRDVIISVPAGAVSGTILGNDCILPSNTYYIVRFVSSTGTILFSDNWYIFGTTLDVGTLVSTSTVGVAFSGAVMLTPQLNADQSIAGNLLPSGTRNLGSGVAPWGGFFSTIATNSLATLNSLSVSSTSTFTGDAQFNGNLTGTAGKVLSAFGTIQSPVFQSSTVTPATAGLIRMAKSDQQCWENNAGLNTICQLLDVNDRPTLSNGLLQLGSTGANGLTSDVLYMNTNSLAGTLTFTDATGNLGFAGFTNVTLPPLTRFFANGATAVVTGNFAPSAGFGTTASVSLQNASSNEIRGVISVASSGTGQATNPTVVFTFPGGAYSTAPICYPIKADGVAPSTAYWISQVSTTTTCTFQFVGLPVAGNTYTFEYIVAQ